MTAMARHHGHQAGAVSVAELVNRQVSPCRPDHAEEELARRTPGVVDAPIKAFYIQDDPVFLARILARLRALA